MKLVSRHRHALHQPFADEDSGQGVALRKMQDVKQLRHPVHPVPLRPPQHVQYGVEPLHAAGDMEQVRHLILAALKDLLELIVQNDMQVRRKRLRVESGGYPIHLKLFGDHVVPYGYSRLL